MHRLDKLGLCECLYRRKFEFHFQCLLYLIVAEEAEIVAGDAASDDMTGRRRVL